MEDPSLFRIDWEVLAAIVVLSFFIERHGQTRIKQS